MTINSAVPMKKFTDGPRTHQPERNTLDAAIDQRPYQLEFTITGEGEGELLFRADLKYANGYVIRFDGESAMLERMTNHKRFQLALAPAPLGHYRLVIAGDRFTLKGSNGAWIWNVRDGAHPTGLRMRYNIGSQKWKTVGKLL